MSPMLYEKEEKDTQNEDQEDFVFDLYDIDSDSNNKDSLNEIEHVYLDENDVVPINVQTEKDLNIIPSSEIPDDKHWNVDVNNSITVNDSLTQNKINSGPMFWNKSDIIIQDQEDNSPAVDGNSSNDTVVSSSNNNHMNGFTDNLIVVVNNNSDTIFTNDDVDCIDFSNSNSHDRCYENNYYDNQSIV